MRQRQIPATVVLPSACLSAYDGAAEQVGCHKCDTLALIVAMRRAIASPDAFVASRQ